MHFTLRSKALYFALFSGLSYGVYRWASSGGSPETTEVIAAEAGAALGIPGSALAPLPARTPLTTPQTLLSLLQEAAAAAAGMAAAGGDNGAGGAMRLTSLRVCLAPPGCPPAQAAAALPAFLAKVQQLAVQPDGPVELCVALEPAVYDALRAAGGAAPRAETSVPGIVGADMLATAAALAGGAAGQPWTTSAGTYLTAPEHAGQYCGAPAAQLPSAAASADTATAGHVLLLLPEGPAAAAVLKGLKGGQGWYGPPLWEQAPVEVPLSQVQLHAAGGAFVSGTPGAVQLHGGQPLLAHKPSSPTAHETEGAQPPAAAAWWYAPSAGQLALVLGQEVGTD